MSIDTKKAKNDLRKTLKLISGYYKIFVIMCWLKKGSDNMAKRRPSGDGMIRRKKKEVVYEHD